MLSVGLNSSNVVERECGLVADIAPAVAKGPLVRTLDGSRLLTADGRPYHGREMECEAVFGRRGLRMLSDAVEPLAGRATGFSRPVYGDANHATLAVTHFGAMVGWVEVERLRGRWTVTKETVSFVS
jgi:hypothetical protein